MGPCWPTFRMNRDGSRSSSDRCPDRRDAELVRGGTAAHDRRALKRGRWQLASYEKQFALVRECFVPKVVALCQLHGISCRGAVPRLEVTGLRFAENAGRECADVDAMRRIARRGISEQLDAGIPHGGTKRLRVLVAAQ